MEKFNPYQHVTDIIIERLRNGELPWMRRYSAEQKALGPARNGMTGRQYRGINKLLLPLQGRYFTFNNVQDAGGHVKKGSKSYTAVFFKLVEKKFVTEKIDDVTGETVVKEGKQYIPIPRLYNLFHESQIEFPEGAKPLDVEATYNGDIVTDAEEIIMNYRFREGVIFNDGAEEPSYEVATDTINVPERKRYASAEMYYLDVFHEIGHSTGHPSRLNRKLPVKASSGLAYTREELISSIISANLMDVAGMSSLDAIDSVAAECKHWEKALSEDNHMILYASSRASKATDFILTGEIKD